MPESVRRSGLAWGSFFSGVTATSLRRIRSTRATRGRLRVVDDDLGPVFSHFGICVSDLERSLRFYCDALGFEKAESHAIGSEFARAHGIPRRRGDVAVHPPRPDGH